MNLAVSHPVRIDGFISTGAGAYYYNKVVLQCLYAYVLVNIPIRHTVDEGEITMKIMVAYDARVEAKEALRIAKKHAKAFDASVHIVTSMQIADDSDQEKVSEAKQSLEYAKTLLDVDKISCSTHLLIRGLGIGEDLVKYAIENEIDEIFVGIKKRSKVGKLLLGSTAQFIILKAPCQVVTVRII